VIQQKLLDLLAQLSFQANLSEEGCSISMRLL